MRAIPRASIRNLLLAGFAVGALFLIVRSFGPEALKEWVERAGMWAPAALVLAKASTIVFAPLSGSIFYALAGAMFGFWKAFALLVLGDAIGGIIAFWISRVFGRTVVEQMLGGDTHALARVLKQIGTVRGFLITRTIFITAQDPMAYAAGLTRIAFVPFLIIHVTIGLAPTAALTWFGAILIEKRGTFGLGGMIAAIGVVCGLSALAFVWYTSQTLLEESRDEQGRDPR